MIRILDVYEELNVLLEDAIKKWTDEAIRNYLEKLHGTGVSDKDIQEFRARHEKDRAS